MMTPDYKLYMVLLGCTPQGRLTEQHDIFFGISTSIEELIPQMYAFWPDGGELHVDSYREVTRVDNYAITIAPKDTITEDTSHLFFLNLGGYKVGEFEEYHYKMLAVAETMGGAIKQSKKTAFYKHVGFKGAESHIDEKYGIDVDNMHKVQDILAPHFKDSFTISIGPARDLPEDTLHIGYLKLGRYRPSKGLSL